MAITQDELGNYYDDGFGSDSFHDFTGVTGNGMVGSDSLHDFNPTPILTNSMTGINSFHDFNPAPVSNSNMGGIKDFLNSTFGGPDNFKTASAAAGALAGAFGGTSPNSKRSGYQGSIPQLQAVRNMVTAPPTANYRPGQGGVRYNSDVSYVPRGSVPMGMPGTMTSAAQVAADNAARANATAPKSNSTLTNIAKTAGIAALAKQILGGTGNKTTDGLKTIIDKITGGTGTKTVPGTGTGTGTKTVPGTGTGTNNANVIGAATKAVTGAGGANTPTKSGGGGGSPAGGGASSGGGGGVSGGVSNNTNGIAYDDDGNLMPGYELDENNNPVFVGYGNISDTSGSNENGIAYDDDGNLMPGYELDENNNAVFVGDATSTIYDPSGGSVTSDTKTINEMLNDRDTNIVGGDSFHDFTGVEDTENLTRSLGGGSGVNLNDYFDYGGGDDYSFNLDDLGLGGEDYSNYFDFGGGDDFGFDLADYDFAKGGAINMAKGRYLRGNTDGMADKLPARIGQKQPAALSHGEFVVPADVVSHLGNGNSDAGAKKLYQMMDKIRVARTGNKKQGKQINPDKFMPGGLAKAYAQGGSVKHFVTGGETGVPSKDLAGIASAGITGSETSPNTFAGDYIANMLGKTQALSESPYQQYMGPLTAGASGLQDKMFTGLQNTAFPSNLGQTFSSQGAYPAPSLNMDAYKTQPIGNATPATPMATPAQPQGIASQYMNPYLQSVLQPQLEELRRTSQINMQPGLAKLTQAGGYGGGRQAIMESEANRNLLQQQNQTIGAGYANAYDKAQQQFNTEQTQGRSLADLIGQQGNVQRGIEAEGIAADKSAFEEARENPY